MCYNDEIQNWFTLIATYTKPAKNHASMVSTTYRGLVPSYVNTFIVGYSVHSNYNKVINLNLIITPIPEKTIYNELLLGLYSLYAQTKL